MYGMYVTIGGRTFDVKIRSIFLIREVSSKNVMQVRYKALSNEMTSIVEFSVGVLQNYSDMCLKMSSGTGYLQGRHTR